MFCAFVSRIDESFAGLFNETFKIELISKSLNFKSQKAVNNICQLHEENNINTNDSSHLP